MEWWMWPLALFAATFAMGIVAVLAGVGGGVLFVPIVGAFSTISGHSLVVDGGWRAK